MEYYEIHSIYCMVIKKLKQYQNVLNSRMLYYCYFDMLHIEFGD